MSAALFLGIDGGGTRCRARIRDGAGRLLGEGEGGPSNIRLGEAAWAEILAAASEAAAEAGLGPDGLRRLHAGMALAGVAQAPDRQFVLDRAGAFAGLVLDTDAYGAWLGAHGGRDGAILIVGTGSCGLAVVGGRRFNVSGWGAEISDEASAMSLGRGVIRRAIWAHEGIVPPSPLAAAVMERFGGDPSRIVTWADAARPTDYGSFAPLAFAHAAAGDWLAIALVSEAAAECGRMIARLLAVGAPKVALLGGMAAPLTPWLAPPWRAALAEPEGDAVEGAILMARQAFGGAA